MAKFHGNGTEIIVQNDWKNLDIGVIVLPLLLLGTSVF